jgi:hypothetical protein
MEEDLWIKTDGDPLDDPAPSVKRVARTERGHIGCPLLWFKLVFPLVHGKNELAVALWLYRLRAIRRSRTITVTNGPLSELGIDRFAKYRALRRLARARLIIIKSSNRKSIHVRFCK